MAKLETISDTKEDQIPIVDDGFYRLYATSITYRQVREAGIRLIPLGPLSGRIIPLHDPDFLRLVFGTVTDEEGSEEYLSIECFCGERSGGWVACETNEDENFQRIRWLLDSLIHPPKSMKSRGRGR